MAKRETKKANEANQRGQLAERALGPATDEFGRALAPLGERAGKLTVYVGDKLLGLLEQSVFGLERVAEWVQAEVSKRLRNLPDERIVEPNPRIAVPAVQALTYSIGEVHIREMYANLLAADMNADMKEKAHPAFVEIIKEMTPADARLVKLISKVAQVEFRVRLGFQWQWHDAATHYSLQVDGMTDAQIATSLSNLERLGIARITDDQYPLTPDIQEKGKEIEERYQYLKAEYEAAKEPGKAHGTLFMHRAGIYLTPLGSIFADVCLEKDET